MPRPTEAVLFDIDGTICEYVRGTADILPVAFERAGVDPFFTAVQYETRFAEFAEQTDTVRELRAECFSTLARESGCDPEQGRAVAQAYAAERDHTNVVFREGAREVLDTFDTEYHLAAVTNGPPGIQTAKLEALGVDHFERVVHAGYDAPAKPAPEPFHAALAAVGTGPERAVYVGNSPEMDVAGAQNAGVRAALLGDLIDPEPAPAFLLESPRGLLARPWE
ncbi:MAG: HAD family hydrolase [Halovenus sp.]